MSISSDEINFLIQRYFYECGFEHSRYTFERESQSDSSQMNGSQIPPGALITLLQKGLLYIQLEKEISSANKGITGYSGSQLSLIDAALREGSGLSSKVDNPVQQDNAISVQLDESNSVILTQKTKNVGCCAWSDTGSYLATGGSENTVVMWNLEHLESVTSVVMQHGDPEKGTQDQICSLDWSSGDLLVTGSTDGSCNIWDSNGSLLNSVTDRTASIHVVKFDPSGMRFVSGDAESVVCVRTDKGELIRKEELDQGAIVDAAWKNETAFAVCCENGAIAVFDQEINDGAVTLLKEHTDRVSAVAWNQSGEYLASCGDDKTVRVWKDKEMKVLQGHQGCVVAIRWHPDDLLASSSYDKTIRIWNPMDETCLHVLVGHTRPVYSLCFSADNSVLFSGSVDKSIKAWRIEDGHLICTSIGCANIRDLQADKTRNYIAACFDGGNIYVVPLENLPLHSE